MEVPPHLAKCHVVDSFFSPSEGKRTHANFLSQCLLMSAIFSDSFIFNVHLILVRIAVDPEPILKTLRNAGMLD